MRRARGERQRRGRPPGPTPKSAATRERLVDSALQLFSTEGYGATTMRDIAAAAGTSVGLSYRYFGSKQAIVLGLYRRQATELDTIVDALGPGSIGARFERAIVARFEGLVAYREALAALFGAGLDRTSGVGVLGDESAEIRQRVTAAMAAIVDGSTPAVPPAVATALPDLMFGAQLAGMLFWLADPTEGQSATRQLTALTGRLIDLAITIVPEAAASAAMAELAGILRPVLGANQAGVNP